MASGVIDRANHIPPLGRTEIARRSGMRGSPHRAFAVMQNLCRNGAEQSGSEETAAARGHHDQIGARGPRHFDNGGTWIAFFDDYLHSITGGLDSREEFPGEQREALSGFFNEAGNTQVGDTGSFCCAVPQGRNLDEIHQR